MMRRTETDANTPSQSEEGFLLLALVVVIFLLALFLTIAAPTVARSLQRDKEVESEHRAQQYVRAIHNYYLKFNSYPVSIEALLSQNNQHFLRQQYKDPLTGGDYRLIHFGEAKTQVKGFFGEPLEGFQQGSLGALSGNASGIGTGIGGAGSTSAAGGTGSSTFGSGGFSLGNSSFSSGQGSGTASASGSTTPGTGAAGNASTIATNAGQTGTGSTSSFGSGTSATQFQGSKGMIVGVGSNASGHGSVEWNGSANIEDWEFLYDHRTWLIKQRVSIFGGGMTATNGSSGFGTSFGNSNSGTTGSGTTPFGGSNAGTSGAGTINGTGTTSTGSTSGTPASAKTP